MKKALSLVLVLSIFASLVFFPTPQSWTSTAFAADDFDSSDEIGYDFSDESDGFLRWLDEDNILPFSSGMNGGSYLDIDAEDEDLEDEEDEALALSGLSSFDIAAACGGIWHIQEGCVKFDAAPDDSLSCALPLSALLNESEEEPAHVYLASIGEDRCAVLFFREGAVALTELSLADGEIVVLSQQDVSDDLGVLCDSTSDWLELDMSSIGQQLFFSALDAQFAFHFYLYDPEAGSLQELYEKSLMEFSAAVPRSDDVLLVGVSIADENLLEFSNLSLKDGQVEPLGSVRLDSALEASCFAWSESEQQLYFTLNNVAWRMKLAGGRELEAFAVLEEEAEMARLGLVYEGQYYVLSPDGALLSCDLRTDLSITTLHIADTREDSDLSEAARVFSLTAPEYTVSVNADLDEEELFENLELFDANVLQLDGPLFAMLMEENGLADLSDSSILADAVADMPEALQYALTHDGTLLAFPVAVTNICQTLNVSALSELTGLREDKLPTDWEEFLKLVKTMGKKGLFEKQSEISLLGTDLSTSELRQTMLEWLLQDCCLWIEQDLGRLDDLAEEVLPALKAFQKVNWNRLGPMDYEYPENEIFDEDEEIAVFSDSDASIHILSDGILEISVMSMEDGAAFWPFSLRKGGERLIPQTISVFVISSDTPHREALLRFVESLWEKTDPIVRMELCWSIREPVLNDAYDEDLTFMEETLEDYELLLDYLTDEIDRLIAEEEMQELRDFLEDYRDNARWLITEESISYYQAQSTQMIPTGGRLATVLIEDDSMLSFLNGNLTPKQYAARIAQILREETQG